jgi:hypothetical protein
VGLGIIASDDVVDVDTMPAMCNIELEKSSCYIYDALTRRLPLLFVNADIIFNPLKPGLWVLVGFQDWVWLEKGL